MNTKQQKAVLLQTIVLDDGVIHAGSVVDVVGMVADRFMCATDSHTLIIPPMLLQPIPPDSPRVHKHKKKSNKRKKNVQRY